VEPPLSASAWITWVSFLLRNNLINFGKRLRRCNGAKAYSNGGNVYRKQGGGHIRVEGFGFFSQPLWSWRLCHLNSARFTVEG